MSSSNDEMSSPMPEGPLPRGFSWQQILLILMVLVALGAWWLTKNRPVAPSTPTEPAVRATMARELEREGYHVSPWEGREGPMYIVVPKEKIITEAQATELALFIRKKLKGAGVDSAVHIRTPQAQTIAVAN